MSPTATRTAATSVSREDMEELQKLAWALLDRLMELNPIHRELALPTLFCGNLVGLLRERMEAVEAQS